MNIPEHRAAIDKLDAQIVRLINERTKHVLAIGEIKLKAGEEIYAPHRERAVLQRVSKLNAGPITNEQLRAIYRASALRRDPMRDPESLPWIAGTAVLFEKLVWF